MITSTLQASLTANFRLSRLILAITLFGFLTLPVHAQRMPREDVVDVPAISEGLCVSNVFQTNMVLQRDKPIHVWGWAAPGEQVTVTFAGEQASVKANKDRSWKVTLPAVPANSQPQQVTVKGKRFIKTAKKQLTLRGTAKDPGGVKSVTYRINSGKMRTAKGKRFWKIPVKLKRKVTNIKIYATDKSNNRSRATKVRITRK
jgi:hypothetical protein